MKQRKETESAENSDASMDSDEYDARNRSCASLNSDELEGDLNLSECEDMGNVQEKRKERRKKKKGKGRHFRQEIDTNVFKIQFSTLKDKAEIATGDPIFCVNCKGCFNMYSKVEDRKSEEGNES